MLPKLIFIPLFSIILLLDCCKSGTENTSSNKSTAPTTFSTNNTETEDNGNSVENSDKTQTGQNSNKNTNSCNLGDDTYSATVDYHNPETGYSQTYTLDVEVEDCQVVQIDFPNGGWLDQDHINAADIDEDGNANVNGEEGRTYEIHIDN